MVLNEWLPVRSLMAVPQASITKIGELLAVKGWARREN